ncbi:MAG TPA: hypothetical protein VFP28_05920, partial [Gemmatimonadales bacterium]|nr:hypothetical protein [Gemmatimonadales bacterium]
MRHRRRGLRAALLVAISLVTACHSRPDVAYQVPEDSVPVEVANHNWSDVVIYVVRDGFQSRLGVAGAASAT